MPITRICYKDFSTDFINKYKPEKVVEDKDNPNIVWMTFATGRVVNLREMNGYSDSDFYATYMTADGKFVEFEYNSTRGAHSGGAAIDATPEVLEAYQKHLRAESEAMAAYYKAQRASMCEKAGITVEQFDRLSRVYSGENLAAIMKLLQTRRFRSSFRQSIAQQVRDWVKEETPEYRHPLTARQMQYL